MSILTDVGKMLEDCAKKHDDTDYRCGKEEKLLLYECDIHYRRAIEYILTKIKDVHGKRGKIRTKHKYNDDEYMAEYRGQYFEIDVVNDDMREQYETLRHTYKPDDYRTRVWREFDRWTKNTLKQLECGETAYAFNFDLDHQGLGIPITNMEEYNVICRIYESRDGASVKQEPYHRRYNEQVERLNKEMEEIASEYGSIDDFITNLKLIYPDDEIFSEVIIDNGILTFKFALKNEKILQRIATVEKRREASLYEMWESEYKIRTWYYEAVEKAMNGKSIELPKMDSE
jgi:hypothetical protein